MLDLVGKIIVQADQTTDTVWNLVFSDGSLMTIKANVGSAGDTFLSAHMGAYIKRNGALPRI